MNQNQNNIPIEPLPNAFNQVDQQVANGQPATVLVERSNGDITTAQVAGITEGVTDVFFGDITNGPQEGMQYKTVGNERLNDQYQERLATQLAGVALRSTVEPPLQRGAGVTSSENEPIDPQEKARKDLQELVASMDEVQQRLLGDYGIATDELTLREKRGDYNGAAAFIHKAQEIRGKMPPDTLSKLDKYMVLWKAKSTLDIY